MNPYEDLGMPNRGRAQAGGLGMIRDVHQSAVGIMLAREQAWQVERAHIARVLDEFSRSPISMSSVQVVLDLAVELNKETR